MVVIFVIQFVIFVSVAFFLSYELIKKFGFMRDFAANSDHLVSWNYMGRHVCESGMRNIVLRGSKPFCALVGFKLEIPLLMKSGFDYYGFVSSDEHGVAVISTYMGRGECEFQFLVSTDLADNPIMATSSDVDQLHQPNATFQPHWYQRLGFYG